MVEAGATRERRVFLTLTLVCVAVSVLYIVAMLMVTQGHFVAQVADLYLIAQYARGFVEGHPFQYNPGDPPTSGATSLLHTAFLALAHLVGFQGEGLIAFAILSGAVFMILTVLQSHAAALSLGAPSKVALLGALLVALNGPLAWSFHYGADIALVLFLSSWIFAAWVRAEEAPGVGLTGFILPACLLALSRPEAAILVTGLGLLALWEDRRESPARTIVPSRALKYLAPAATAFAALVFLRLMTGSAANTSFSQKLISENLGFFSAAVISVEYWSDVLRGLLLGFYPSSQRIGLGGGEAPFYAPPLLLVFVFLALLKKDAPTRRALQFLAMAVVTAVAVTPTIHVGFHFNRYLLFALPPLLVLMAIGLNQAAALVANGAQDAAFRGLRLAALTFAVISVARFGLVYMDSAATVYGREEALFSFINRTMPPETTFLNNGTAIEYRTGRKSLNLSGLVTPEFTSVRPAETEASAFEILSRLPASDLPRFLILPEKYAAESGLSVLVGGPPIYVTSTLQLSELAIYPATTELLGRQHNLHRADIPSQLVRTDSLNVTDPAEERAHRYRFESAAGNRSFFGALKKDTYLGEGRGAGLEVADGGRLIFGAEAFEIATPGRGDVWIAMRTSPDPSVRVEHPIDRRRIDFGMGENRLRISTALGTTDWFVTPLEAGWNEVVYRLPEALAGSTTTRVRIEGRFSSYAYWVFRQAM